MTEQTITHEGAQNHIVSCENVSRVYRRGDTNRWLERLRRRAAVERTVTAVDSVSLAVTAGESVGIAGPSGSGKSTLLSLIGGIDVPTTGSVVFNGQEISSLSSKQRTTYRRNHVGFVFQDFRLLDALSATDNVALPLVEAGIKASERRDQAHSQLAEVGLADRSGHKPAELSGGERQRVAIARALVNDPALLIADEPTGELDRNTGEAVIELLTSYADERAVVIATHDEAVLNAVDRVVRLVDGRIAST